MGGQFLDFSGIVQSKGRENQTFCVQRWKASHGIHP